MSISFVSFGPDLEPLEEEARRGARSAGPRRDGIAVTGAAAEVVEKLRLAQASHGGWCELEQVVDGAEHRPAWVNAATVRLVFELE